MRPTLTPKLFVLLLTGTLASVLPLGVASSGPVVLSEYAPSAQTWCDIREQWVQEVLATHEQGTWATMEFSPTNEQLAKLGLPSREWLMSHRFASPTLAFPDGTSEPIAELAAGGPDASAATAGTVSFAGAGCFGIRPGAWLLTVTPTTIGWCSMAHVYGAPGSYQISTAGHCGKIGDIATVIAGTGSRSGATGVILLDFGKFVKSTGDAGIGKDWALIGIDSPWQKLVSPTMCFWGGPIGTYTKTGATLAVALPSRLPGTPTITTNPDPLLVQEILHYGHGTGIGAGGTPRAGTAFYWTTTTMIWEGAITPGDSGSGSNTAGGDAIGAQREAAAINTHIFVDPSLRTGIGYLASTRVTQVTASLADGQLVPYPVPLPGAP